MQQSSDSHNGPLVGAQEPQPVPIAEPPEPTVVVNPDSFAVTSDTVRPLGFFEVGEIVGGTYEILDFLGRGAMGMVYRARHVSMPAEYALKILTGNQLTELNFLRFQNEAQAIAKLNHPNIIAVYNFGLHDGGLPFYVMDLLAGENLLDKIDKYGPPPVAAALPIFIEVCAGLSFAHRKGIMHRDIKPANFVILDAPDVRGARVKVVDFGIVKFAEELKPDAQKLTALGDVCGSPSYMSPEQAGGHKIDSRSDIYSLGCALFQTLTGKLPFRGRTATDTMLMHFENDAPTLASQGDGRVYGADLERLVSKMLAKLPVDRYQSMDLVAQDLRNVLEGKPLGTPGPVASDTSYGLPSQGGPTGSQYSLPAMSNPNGASATQNPGSSLSGLPGAVGSSGAAGGAASANRARQTMHNLLASDAVQPFSQLDRNQLAELATASVDEDIPAAEAVVDHRPLKIVAGAALVLIISILGAGAYFFMPHGVVKPAILPHGRPVVDEPPERPAEDLTGAAIRTQDAEAKSQSMLSGTPAANLEGVKMPTLTTAKYFSHTVSEGGKQFVEFDFPKPSQTEFLAWITTGRKTTSSAEGKVRFPKGDPITLAPKALSEKLPPFFEKFRPGEISGLYFSDLSVSDNLFNIVTERIPGASRLFISRSPQLTEKILPHLVKQKLSLFFASGCTIDGAKLARAGFWSNLKQLDISKCRNVTPILQKLSGSRNLLYLNVSDCRLSSNDYKLISTLPNLRVLEISHRKISTADLRQLSHLKNLTGLMALYVSVDGDSAAAELAKFPALKNFTVTRGLIKADQLQSLQAARPNLRVPQLGAAQSQGYQQVARSYELDAGTPAADQKNQF